ncbi:MAG TPA: sterol desaturase family protein [Saprospiraceae bacterium]|nr:sterol desaturase family protein [Saprospiraceae bacterium]
MNVDDVVAVSTPLYFVLIGLEMLLSYLKKKKYYTLPDTATNVYLMLLNMGLDVLFMVVTLTVLGFFYQYRLFVIESPVLYWIALFFAEDFAFYWLHRIDHSSRFLWAVHVTHHSSPYFNLTTGFRSSVFQPLYRFLYFIPLALMGFRAVDIFLMYAITQIYGILVHTNFIGKLGFLEKIMVTPSLHRVHHATNIPYLDKNLGMVLIIWDKLFGTYAEEDENEPIAFGLFEKEIKRDPFNVVFHEWRSIFHDMKKVKTWRTKWKYFFMPPGWSHDGSTKTSKELQREFSKHKPS